MQLEHNFRYHRPRWRLSRTVVGFLAALTLLVLWTIPLGSDDFDLKATDLPVTAYGSVVQDAVTHKWVLNETNDEAGLLAAEDREREIAEGRFRITGFFGFAVAGKSFRTFSIHVESDPPGRTTNVTRSGDIKATDEVMAILKPVRNAFLACMKDDCWTSSRTSEEVVDGMLFRVTTRAKVFPPLGNVVYEDAERIR